MSANLLKDIARNAMISHGLQPDFSVEAMRELADISATNRQADATDLTQLAWCSVDNDDSRDLDQLTVAEKLPDGSAKILIAIADVSGLVQKGSAIDQHAEQNTTSVYTDAELFPMVPEKLSTDLTSLSEGEDRLAVVRELVVSTAGDTTTSKVYTAWVRNQAKLAYNSVAAWLDKLGPLPPAAAKVPLLDANLILQYEFAQKMRRLRYQHGALDLETMQPHAILEFGKVKALVREPKNSAKEMIEDFMIAANSATSVFLTQAGYPSLRRVVRSPERWGKIAEVASRLGTKLPDRPDSKTLAEFLAERRVKDPLRFPDLSLTVIKLMGRGEYLVQRPGDESFGHFGLAVENYTHSTAPNRRFPDLMTQRMVKAALKKQEAPYTIEELNHLAFHCTSMENAVDKVERQVRKSTSALYLSSQIGEIFEGIVTGASDKGTWARILNPHVEGMIVKGQKVLDVGDRVRLRLLSCDVERGFIDFGCV
ncbi:MAG: RNB domain-containing ribonuclease [Myxococcota bacterium]